MVSAFYHGIINIKFYTFSIVDILFRCSRVCLLGPYSRFYSLEIE